MNENLIINLLYICGPLSHKQLMCKLDCGFFAIDELLKKLCKEQRVHHEELPDSTHLFMVNL